MLAARQNARQPQERRKHRRVQVDLHGRYILETRQEFSCQAVDMSPGGLLLKAPAVGYVGERVIVYLDQLGRIEGKITRVMPGGFAMSIATTMRKRDKLASQLTWLANRSVLGLPEDRRHARIVPRNPLTVVTLPDGAALNVRLIDVSVSGAAFTSETRIERGTAVTIGSTPGQVVRVTDGGIAVEFAAPIPPERFDENITL